MTRIVLKLRASSDAIAQALSQPACDLNVQMDGRWLQSQSFPTAFVESAPVVSIPDELCNLLNLQRIRFLCVSGTNAAQCEVSGLGGAASTEFRGFALIQMW